MEFRQTPPTLGNQYDSDALLQEYLERTLPRELRQRFEPEYRQLGELSGGELYALSLGDLGNEPVHTQWDAWGNRIDEVEVTEVWKRAQAICAEHGMVAAGYDTELGAYARIHQHLLNYMVQASLDTYNCPLAMTDGAARTLLDSGNQGLIDHALPRLLSRDPKTMWTSGQWMTERIGGSDVGQTETVAHRDGDTWKLYGTKWFTSATTADMAVVAWPCSTSSFVTSRAGFRTSTSTASRTSSARGSCRQRSSRWTASWRCPWQDSTMACATSRRC
jgi:alkylation response protein AidB-like acyl-CoA dehydrogenase